MTMYASSGYCYSTGEEATLVLSSYHAGLGGSPCPYVWDGSKAVAYTYSTSTGACSASTTKVTFPTCTVEGPIGGPNPANSVLDGVELAWLVVAVWAAAFAISVLRKALIK
jgi:hypothetical protein